MPSIDKKKQQKKKKAYIYVRIQESNFLLIPFFCFHWKEFNLKWIDVNSII